MIERIERMDKLSAMRSFRRIVELGGFSAAARELKLSPASVSTHLRDLEAELGVALLARTTRRVSPTEAGRAYYERCVRILDDIEEAELALGTLQTAPRGRLRINAPMSLGVLHVAPAIAAFCRLHPEIEAELALNDRVVDMIEEGFDVSLRVQPRLQDSSLIARRLCRIRYVVAASPAYLKEAGRPQEPGDLDRHRTLVFSISGAPGRWSFRKGEEVRTVEAAPCFLANSSLALREALLAGLGVTLIPECYVGPDLDQGRLVTVLDDWRADPSALHAIYPASRYLSAKVRAFVDFLKDRFADPPPWERRTG